MLATWGPWSHTETFADEAAANSTSISRQRLGRVRQMTSGTRGTEGGRGLASVVPHKGWSQGLRRRQDAQVQDLALTLTQSLTLNLSSHGNRVGGEEVTGLDTVTIDGTDIFQK